MDNYKIECNLISGGINQVFDGTDWQNQNCILFCSSNSIFLYDSIQKRVRVSLVEHRKRVQCARWVVRDDSVMIFSTSEDGSIVQWQCQLDPLNYSSSLHLDRQYLHEIWDHHSWKVISRLDLHSKLNKLAISPLNSQQSILATSNLQGDLFFLSASSHSMQVLHKLSFSKNVQETVCLQQISDDKVLAIMAGYDKKVYFYQLDNKVEGDKVQFVHSCSGHEDNVTDIKIITLSDSSYFIASADKRGSIRIWRLTLSGQTSDLSTQNSKQQNIKVINLFGH